MRFRVIKPETSFDVALTMYRLTETGEYKTYQLTSTEQDYILGDRIPTSLSLEPSEAQELLDELYGAGFRPTRPDFSVIIK